MKAYFSAPSGDDGTRISFEAETNSDQYLLELLEEKGVVKGSEAGDNHEDAFVIIRPEIRKKKIGKEQQDD